MFEIVALLVTVLVLCALSGLLLWLAIDYVSTWVQEWIRRRWFPNLPKNPDPGPLDSDQL